MPRNSPSKSTTAARNFAASPPYSPVKTPIRTYGKGKNRLRTSAPSETVLAYEELELLPLPCADSDAGPHEGSRSLDLYNDTVLISGSSGEQHQSSSSAIVSLPSAHSGASQVIGCDDDIIIVSYVTREQQLEAKLAEATQKALDTQELLCKAQSDLRNIYKVQADSFDCGLCGFTLNNPLALGCGHIYCEGCLAEFCEHHIKERTKRWVCPTCSSKIGREPPATLHLLKYNIELMVKEGELNPKEIFVERTETLDWEKVQRRRRRHLW